MKLIDAQTVELTITYDEPTTNVDGTPLADMAYSTIYITSPAGTHKAPVIAAVDVHGGKHIQTPIQVNAPENTSTSIKMAVSATDLSGNEGPKSVEVEHILDRIGPAVPTGFTIA